MLLSEGTLWDGVAAVGRNFCDGRSNANSGIVNKQILEAKGCEPTTGTKLFAMLIKVLRARLFVLTN